MSKHHLNSVTPKEANTSHVQEIAASGRNKTKRHQINAHIPEYKPSPSQRDMSPRQDPRVNKAPTQITEGGVGLGNPNTIRHAGLVWHVADMIANNTRH